MGPYNEILSSIAPCSWVGLDLGLTHTSMIQLQGAVL
jgi:hypothetical protein